MKKVIISLVLFFSLPGISSADDFKFFDSWPFTYIKRVSAPLVDYLTFYRLEKTSKKCIDPDDEGIKMDMSLQKGVYQGKAGNHKKKGTTYALVLGSDWKQKEVKETDYCKDKKYLVEFSCDNFLYKAGAGHPALSNVVLCPENHWCVDGACVPKPCVDSDGGLVPLEFGKVFLANPDQKSGDVFLKPIPDKCLSKKDLQEEWCKDDKEFSNQINCCQLGMICKDNKCQPPDASYKDSDGDGIIDICESKDICPNIEGVQTEYIYDTDGDGKNDSCEQQYIDKCPEISGLQTNFLFDNDWDGINESCVPVDENFCSEPDPENKYSDGTLYEHDGKYHMGFCFPGQVGYGKILHVICGGDKKWTIDVTTCPDWTACLFGACTICIDTDANSPNPMEEVGKAYLFGSPVIKYDVCDLDNKDTYIDHYCSGYDEISSMPKKCPPGSICAKKTAGDKEIFYCDKTLSECFDSDGGINFDVYGYATKDNSKALDSCASSPNKFDLKYMEEAYCDKDGEISITLKECAEGMVCLDAKPDILSPVVVKCVPEVEAYCKDMGGYVEVRSINGFIYHDKTRCLSDYSGYYIPKCKEDGVTFYASQYNCPIGQQCEMIDDVPVCDWKCYDTDIQDNPNMTGIVNDFVNSPQSDFCDKDENGQAIVRQYKCSSETGLAIPVESVTVCPNGCEDGACLCKDMFGVTCVCDENNKCKT